MNKKKVNRYTIAQAVGVEVRRFSSKKDIDDLLNNIQKYHDNPKNPFFIGDIDINYKEGIITFRKYKKITNPSTLKELDRWTVNLNSDHDLKETYDTDRRNNHPFVIVYRSNKRIRILPIFYKKSAKYLTISYFTESISKYVRDLDFINLILEDKQIESCVRTSIDEYDKLFALRESLKYNKKENVSPRILKEFYQAFVSENDDFNYFNFRLLAVLLKKYEDRINPEPEETEKRTEIFGQMMIADYLMQEIRDMYEEAKLLITEGSLEDVYSKKMIPRHKTTN